MVRGSNGTDWGIDLVPDKLNPNSGLFFYEWRRDSTEFERLLESLSGKTAPLPWVPPHDNFGSEPVCGC